MAFLICCRVPRSYSPPLAPPDSERLRTLRPTSAVSVALPSDTIPHRETNNGNDEADTLRGIFRASPSSHRGYHEAAKSSASFDTSFKFGHANATTPTAKAHRPLKRLGHDIRQRLSQSTFSIHSSKKSIQVTKNSEAAILPRELPEIRISTSFDDLLLSQTVSQGGYDSDAKGVETPSCRRESPASVLIDPEYATKVLHAFNDTVGMSSPSPPYPSGDHLSEVCSHTDLDESPCAKAKSRIDHDNLLRVPEGNHLSRNRATSDPRISTTTQREILPSLLQIGPHEGPADVVRRLSVGLANGTLQVPDTPDLKAMHMPSIVEAIPEWRLSFATPKRASSLHRGDPEVRQALKTLGDRLGKAKRDGAPCEGIGHNQRPSLTSQLDPSVLEYISKNGYESQQNEVSNREDGDNTKISEVDNLQRERNAGLSGNESVHLLDMRISQRLASTSVFPTVSPSRTDLGSDQQDIHRGFPIPTRLNHLPAFAARTSVEPLRKPSDPKTRSLFESDDSAVGRNSQTKRKSVVATDSMDQRMPSNVGPTRPAGGRPNYMSNDGLGAKNLAHRRHPSDSHPNLNSLAIAGRRGRMGASHDQERPRLDPAYATCESKEKTETEQLHRATRRKGSLAEEFGGRKKVPRNTMESQAPPTHANDKMSTIDSFHGISPETYSNEPKTDGHSSEPSNKKVERWFQTQKNEGPKHWGTSAASEANVPNDQLAKTKETKGASECISSDEEPCRTDLRGRDESATDMWERALWLAREDPSFGSSDHGFGSTFGELRQRQSRDLRSSGIRGSHEHPELALDITPGVRSQTLSPGSAAVGRRSRESSNLDKHYLLCIDAKKPLTRPTSQVPLAKAKDRSVADIDKFTGAGAYGHAKVAKHSPMATEPAKDFSTWARYPSHTWHQRNGAAGDKDGVLTRDFSSALRTPIMLGPNGSKLSLMTQPVEMGMRSPDSWRFRKLGHTRRKSRSMDFSNADFSFKAKDGLKKNKRLSLLRLTPFAKWKSLFRNQSGDLRRPVSGRRSSVSKGSETDVPERQIVPGYDGVGSFDAGQMEMGGTGNIAEGVGKRRNQDMDSPSEKSEASWRAGERTRESLEKLSDGELGKGEITNPPIEGQNVPGTTLARSSMSESAYCSDGANVQTPSQSRGLASADGAVRDDWAEIYQDCIQHRDGNDSGHQSVPVGLMGLDKAVPCFDPNHRTTQGFDRNVTDSGESYVSCSVGMSDENNLESDSQGDASLGGEAKYGRDGGGDVGQAHKKRLLSNLP